VARVAIARSRLPSRCCYELFRLAMRLVAATEAAVLVQLEPLARLLLVLRRAVVAALTLGTRQRDDVSHGFRSSRFAVRDSLFGFSSNRELRTATCDHYSRISVIVPAPTVRPPSRIANR